MTVTQIRAYHRPGRLEDAWRLLRDGGAAAALLGGGTDLVVACPPEVRELIDLADAGLRYLTTDDDDTVRIGAMTTFTDLLEDDLLRTHGSGVTHEMLSHVGSVLHRNSATIGGHVARGRLSDVIPVLLALDASVATYDGARHDQPLRDYYASGQTRHIVTELRLPPLPARSAAAFFRFSRAAFDHALVNSCCRVDLDPAADPAAGTASVAAARVVVGEPAVRGRHLAAAEDALVGAPLTAESIEAAAHAAGATADATGDWVISADYRRHLIEVGVRRCLAQVAERLAGGMP